MGMEGVGANPAPSHAPALDKERVRAGSWLPTPAHISGGHGIGHHVSAPVFWIREARNRASVWSYKGIFP